MRPLAIFRKAASLPTFAPLRASLGRVLARTRLRAWARLHTGHRLRVDLDSSVGRSIWLRGRYEPQVEAQLRRHLRPGDRFVDVGANVGYFSILASSLVGPAGEVHAFEPNPGLVSLLADSVRANRFTNVRVNALALWSEPSEHVLQLEPSSAQSFVRADREAKGGAALRVPATTLDDYLAEAGLPSIHVVKIDVEGAELQVLRGARRVMERDRPLLVMELLDWGLARYGDDIGQVFRLLGALGYAARDLDDRPVGDAVEAARRLSHAWVKNLVFEHESDPRAPPGGVKE
jgi:FkbM family methyltransferase